MRPSLPPSACVVLMLCLFMFGCAGSGSTSGGGYTAPVITPVTNPVTTPSSGPTVSVMISDPQACKAPGGTFAHIYITIADVKASTKADATANDPSFVDLTPNLASAPQQFDLLGQADSRCFLGSLSVAQQVLAGNYQQVRIFLAPDSAASKVQNNGCGASYSNCLVLSDNSLHDLELAPASASGIELSTSQIANGSVTINASDQSNIDVDFDACSSILLTSTGEYEFNPTVHAGVIPSTGGTITGTVVSSATGQALHGGQVVVALEQKDAKTGIDHILMRTTAGNNGSFVLCPVPQGTYDLVAVGVDGANVSYSAGVETGIQAGQLAGQIPLVPGSAQGMMKGAITAQNNGRPAVGVSVAVQPQALQELGENGPMIVVPVLPSQSPLDEAMLTENESSCPAGVDCAAFVMQLPSTAPNVVACSEQTAQFTQQSASPGYTAEAFAEIPGSGGIASCVSNSVSVTATAQGRSIVLNPDQSTTAATLAFTQCE